MNFEYSALSDVGRHRANNEDAVMVDPARGIVVLADGMGGYNAGEVASALAVDLIAGELGRWLEEAATVASTPSRTPCASHQTPPPSKSAAKASAISAATG